MKNIILLGVFLLCSIYTTLPQTQIWTKHQSDASSLNKPTIYTVPLSPLVYLGTTYSSIVLMDTKTGELVQQFKNIYKPQNDWWRSGTVIAVTPSNKYMVSLQLDTLLLWDTKETDSIIQKRIVSEIINVLASSGDGERIFIETPKSTEANEMIMIETASLRDIRRFPIPKKITEAISNYNGTMIAYRLENDPHHIHIISTTAGELIKTLTIDYNLVSMRFSNDDISILTYHNEKLVRHNLNGTVSSTYQFPNGNSGTLSPDEKYIAYLEAEKLIIYDLTNRTSEVIQIGKYFHNEFLPPVKFSGDGSSILIGDYSIVVVDRTLKKVTHTLSVPQIADINLFGGNKYLTLNSLGGNSFILNADNGNFAYSAGEGDIIGSLSSAVVVTTTNIGGGNIGKELSTHNLQTRMTISIPTDYIPNKSLIAVSDNGKMSAVASDSQSVIVYNLENMEENAQLSLDLIDFDKITYLQFIKNDSAIGVLTDEGYFIISTITNKVIQYQGIQNRVPYPYGHRRYITENGRYILVFSSDIYVFDTETQQKTKVWDDKSHPDSYYIQMLKWLDNNTFSLYMNTEDSNNDTMFIVRNNGVVTEKYPIPTNNMKMIGVISPFDCSFNSDSIVMYMTQIPRRFIAWSQNRQVSSVYDIEHLKNNEVLTYPQPTDNELSLHIGNEMQVIGISIYSLEGVHLLSTQINSSNKLTLSTNDFESGIYFLSIRLYNGKFLTKTVQIVH